MSEDRPIPTAENLISLFRRAVHAGQRKRHSHGHGHSRHAQSHVLGILNDNESMSQRDLMGVLHVRSASLSELLAKLERARLITRERSEHDKRNVLITITEEGRAAAREHTKERREGADAMFTAFSDAEKIQFGALLQKLVAELEKDLLPEDGDAHRRGFGHGRHGHESGHEHERGMRHRHGNHHAQARREGEEHNRHRHHSGGFFGSRDRGPNSGHACPPEEA